MPVTVKDIQKSFENSPFFSHMGFEVFRFEEEAIVLKLKTDHYLLNANGDLHGGVHASMLDTIMGMVIRAATKTRVMTLNLTIQYPSSVSSAELFAEAKILRKGYQTVFAEGEMKASDGKVIAKGVGTFKLIRDQ